METTYEFDLSISSAVPTGTAQATDDGREGPAGPLTPAQLEGMQRYWHAVTYLPVTQISLRETPLLREPLRVEHIKPRLLGHWGTSPGLSLVYVHMNRVILARDLDAIFLAGPGHGGPAVLANVYLEGTYAEIYPAVTMDLPGLQRLVRQ